MVPTTDTREAKDEDVLALREAVRAAVLDMLGRGADHFEVAELMGLEADDVLLIENADRVKKPDVVVDAGRALELAIQFHTTTVETVTGCVAAEDEIVATATIFLLFMIDAQGKYS